MAAALLGLLGVAQVAQSIPASLINFSIKHTRHPFASKTSVTGGDAKRHDKNIEQSKHITQNTTGSSLALFHPLFNMSSTDALPLFVSKDPHDPNRLVLDDQVMVNRTAGDHLLLQNALEGSIFTSKLFPLIWTTEQGPRLRTMEYLRHVTKGGIRHPFLRRTETGRHVASRFGLCTSPARIYLGLLC